MKRARKTLKTHKIKRARKPVVYPQAPPVTSPVTTPTTPSLGVGWVWIHMVPELPIRIPFFQPPPRTSWFCLDPLGGMEGMELQISICVFPGDIAARINGIEGSILRIAENIWDIYHRLECLEVLRGCDKILVLGVEVFAFPPIPLHALFQGAGAYPFLYATPTHF